MNMKRAAELQKTWHEEQHNLLVNKGSDYASTSNAVANFHRVASVCATLDIRVDTPQGIALVLIVHKLNRLCNILSAGGTVRNESLEQNIADLQVYADCLRLLITESREDVRLDRSYQEGGNE